MLRSTTGVRCSIRSVQSPTTSDVRHVDRSRARWSQRWPISSQTWVAYSQFSAIRVTGSPGSRALSPSLPLRPFGPDSRRSRALPSPLRLCDHPRRSAASDRPPPLADASEGAVHVVPSPRHARPRGNRSAAAAIVRADARFPEGATFVHTVLHEPDKAALAAGGPIDRELEVQLVTGPGLGVTEAIVSLTQGEVTSWEFVEGVRPTLLFGEAAHTIFTTKEHPDYVAALAARHHRRRQRADRPVARGGLRLRGRDRPAHRGASRSCAPTPRTTGTPGRSRA